MNLTNSNCNFKSTEEDKIKVLLINRIHYVAGGADRVYLNTGNLLNENKHKVAYFSTLDSQNIKSEYSNFFIKNNHPKKKSFLKKTSSILTYLYNFEASRNLSKLINEFKPDIAHLHLFYGIQTSSILKTLKKHKVPIVITLHDYKLICPTNLNLDRHGNICEKCVSSKFYNCSLKLCSNGKLFESLILTIEAYLRKFVIDPLLLVDRFIFVSQFCLNKHTAYDTRYVNNSSHLYNFTEFTPTKTTQKGEYILYYGRLSREKGIKTLINAAIKTNTKLQIVGDGPLKKEILEAINEAELITYLGFISGTELTELIEKSSFVAVPSEWYENNPMTVVESFSLGKPVIGSKIGGIPELVNKNTGLIFEAGNTVELSDRLMEIKQMSLGEYRNMSNNCREFAKLHFSKQQHYKQLVDIYKSVIPQNIIT